MTGEPILIIDDTPVNLRLTRILLVNEGHTVLTAASAEEALELLQHHHPQLILVDIQLPGIDGLEFTRRVRQDPEMRGVGVVALTAFAMKGDEQKALDAGCDGYITKPIDTRTLGASIRDILAKRQQAQPQAAAEPADVAASEMESLRRLFLAEGQERSRQMLVDLEGNFDTKEAAKLLHQWVGTGGLLGYPAIARLAREGEALLRERPLDNGQLRESLVNLALAFTSPREARDPELPEFVVRSLEGKRVAAVGLPANEKERLCIALDRVRAQPVFFDPADRAAADSARECDMAVVHVSASGSEAAWLDPAKPAFSGHPVVLAGTRDDLLALDGPAQAMAREFLMDYWQPEEALVRLSVALNNFSAPAGIHRPAERPRPSGRMEVVVADDDPIVRSVVRTTLQNFGMLCHTAGSGQEALELIRKLAPQAAVLDVNMPGMDGYEVLSAIREQNPSIRILMLTARQQENDVLRGFTLGADDYVVKPFSPVELTARLKRLLGR